MSQLDWILALAIIKAIVITVLTFTVIWFGVRLKHSERRQDRILTLSEGFAMLGDERKRAANSIVSSKAEEVKEELKKVPEQAATLTVEKIKEAVEQVKIDSGMHKQP